MQLGPSKLERIIAVGLFIVLMGYLVVRVFDLIEAAEKVAVINRIQQLQAGADWKFAELMSSGQRHQGLLYADSNPFDLVDLKKSDDYLGSVEQVDWSTIATQTWVFNRQTGVLSYRLAYPERVNHGGEIHDRLQWHLQVEVIEELDPFSGGGGKRQRVERLKIVPIVPYQWK